MHSKKQNVKHKKNYYEVDDKWKSLITILQFSFLLLIVATTYMIVICFAMGHSSYSILILPIVIIAFLLERQLYIAKKTKNLKCINKVLRGGMRVLGLLY